MPRRSAQCMLGACYEIGKGANQDYTESVKWYRLAAEQGDDIAQYLLGICYDEGKGVEKDEIEAAKWYRLLAEQKGDEIEQYISDFGSKCVDKDKIEVVKWWYSRLAM